MFTNQSSEAVVKLAESILKINFPDGMNGLDNTIFEKYIQNFIFNEISDYDTGKLTSENLVQLFEKYCSFEQMKSEIQI